MKPDCTALKALIIQVLTYLNMMSEKAVLLELLTCANESDLGKFRTQIGGGPAKGIFQMEPATYTDCWRYINLHPELKEKLEHLMPGVSRETFNWLENNDTLAIAMSRIKYWMIPEPLPNTIAELAKYYKKYYNTEHGAATAEEAMEKYNRYVK